jgi:hypothetical protein
MKLANVSEGRDIQLRGRIAMCLPLLVGALLLLYSVNVGTMIGSEWYGTNARFLWHMNNYIVMEAQYAYSIFGLATLAIGGLATGLAMAAFFTVTKTKKHILILIAAFFVAIIMTGLGFNTLDFMLGSFYWTNMTYPPPVMVPLVGAVDVWNFYFFFFVVPLWAGGFLIGLGSSYFTFIHYPRKAAAAYVAKKKLSYIVKQNQQKTYIAESKVSWRTRRLLKETFDDLN